MNHHNITIIGDGAMATVCSLLLHSKGHEVTLWSAFPDYARHLSQCRENTKFLPGFSIPAGIKITSDMQIAFEKPEIIINAVPCQYLRRVWKKLSDSAPENSIYLSVTKGIENKTLLRPSEILEKLLNRDEIVVLSGPNIAIEIVQGLPATAVAACKKPGNAKTIQSAFSTSTFRVYTNEDVTGVEVAGAMKNVIAIAAGIIDGLKIGNNTKAALLTRGLVEITRLGVAMGANRETFSGLAGLGDLVTTCISPHGRNRRLGELIGRGFTLDNAQKQIQSVVEGVATTKSMVDLAQKHRVDMPITMGVANIIFNDKSPQQAIKELMVRDPKDEFEG